MYSGAIREEARMNARWISGPSFVSVLRESDSSWFHLPAETQGQFLAIDLICYPQVEALRSGFLGLSEKSGRRWSTSCLASSGVWTLWRQLLTWKQFSTDDFRVLDFQGVATWTFSTTSCAEIRAQLALDSWLTWLMTPYQLHSSKLRKHVLLSV